MGSNEAILHKMLQSRLFEYMSLSEVESMYSIAKHVSFKAGDYIIQENEEGEDFFWIHAGRVSVEITAPDNSGKKVQLSTLNEGNLLGEMVLLGKNRRTASAKALTDCDLVSWKCTECFKIFNEDSHLGFRLMNNFAQILAHRIHEMNLRMRDNSEDLQSDFLRYLRSA
ncbi:MAG: cyclic nucleotide-binding domain-containing protein [Bdellovibrionota bacterium]